MNSYEIDKMIATHYGNEIFDRNHRGHITGLNKVNYVKACHQVLNQLMTSPTSIGKKS